MKGTWDEIRAVLDAIESGEDAQRRDEMSMDEIAAILLGRKNSRKQALSGLSDMQDCLADLQKKAALEYYLPLPEEASFRMKLGNFVKRVIRRLMKPIMLPIIDNQTRYNQAALVMMEKMYQHEEALNVELCALRQLVLTLGKKLEEGGSDHE